MEFNVKKRNGFSVVAIVENATIESDVLEPVFGLTEGKKDYLKLLGERINPEFLMTLKNLAYNAFSFDEQEFDSYDLMQVMFNKLPSDKKQKFAEWAKSEIDDNNPQP